MSCMSNGNRSKLKKHVAQRSAICRRLCLEYLVPVAQEELDAAETEDRLACKERFVQGLHKFHSDKACVVASGPLRREYVALRDGSGM